MSRKTLQQIVARTKNERRGGAPHEAWVSQNRDILMMQVRNTTDASSKQTLGGYVHHFFDAFVPMEAMAVAARALGVFLLTVGIVAGGGLASAQVYRDAVPGDMLYGMKLAVEKAQIVLAPNEGYRTSLHTEFADRRMDEIARLAEGDTLQQHLVSKALVAFEKELGALDAGLESLRVEDPEGVAEVAKLMERKMAVYQKMLRTASANLPSEVRTEVALTRNRIDDVTIGALAVIVEKHREGDTHAPREVVMSKLGQRVTSAEDAFMASLPIAEDAEKPETTVRAEQAIAAARVLIEEEKYEAALLKITEVAELTQVNNEEEGVVEEEVVEEEVAPAEEEATPIEEDVPAEEEEVTTQE